MGNVRAKIAAGGRVVLPAEYRRALGLREGDEVILRLTDGEVRILSPRQAIQRAQELVDRYVPSGRSLADELIAERRQEARHE
jgi:AbrB family looped-hinge helix DNA binding protein